MPNLEGILCRLRLHPRNWNWTWRLGNRLTGLPGWAWGGPGWWRHIWFHVRQKHTCSMCGHKTWFWEFLQDERQMCYRCWNDIPCDCELCKSKLRVGDKFHLRTDSVNFRFEIISPNWEDPTRCFILREGQETPELMTVEMLLECIEAGWRTQPGTGELINN